MDWQPQLHALGLVGLAALLGMLVGLEREIARKPAGLRTHAFVGGAAALLMVLGRFVIDAYQAPETSGTIRSDPIRVIQAIVIGISFLGAGTIIRVRGERVEGLTTAASVLFTAGIGIAVAVEQFVLAAGCTLGGVLVLWLIAKVEQRMGLSHTADSPADADRTEPAPQEPTTRDGRAS